MAEEQSWTQRSDDGNFCTLTDEEVKEARQTVERCGVGGYLRYLQEKEESWKTIPLNIALIGNPGVGKSSFINTIRGLTADDEGAAAVGETETTADIEAYSHPKNPLLMFWDLPGVGTPKFPRESYLKAVEAERYDFFLLLFANRFTENDAWLGKEIKALGKRFFYVRTKMACTVANCQMAHRTTLNKSEIMRKIRQNARDYLKDEDTPVFLIDNYEPQSYEFPKLEERLIEDFPTLKWSAMFPSNKPVREQCGNHLG